MGDERVLEGPLTTHQRRDPSTGRYAGATLQGMDEQAGRIAALFDRLAADYDRSGVDFFEPIASGLLDRVPPAPPVPGDER